MLSTKKFLSILLALALAVGLFPASGLITPASAASGDFVIENGVLMKYTGTNVDVVIPSGVTSIDGNAF